MSGFLRSRESSGLILRLEGKIAKKIEFSNDIGYISDPSETIKNTIKQLYKLRKGVKDG